METRKEVHMLIPSRLFISERISLHNQNSPAAKILLSVEQALHAPRTISLVPVSLPPPTFTSPLPLGPLPRAQILLPYHFPITAPGSIHPERSTPRTLLPIQPLYHGIHVLGAL